MFAKKICAISGENAHVVANLFGDLNGTDLDRMRLIAQNGSELFNVDMSRCGESEEVYRTTKTFILPSTAFYIVSAFSHKPVTETWRW